jgi:hypothetical protein
MPEKSLDTQKLASLGLLVFALVSVIAAAYFYKQNTVLRQNSQAATESEIQDLIAKVGKLIVLPSGEQPTIATVADPEKLKSQPFFANAQKDDKVLIYTNARKAILYSPSQNKIIEVAPINIGPAPEAAAK